MTFRNYVSLAIRRSESEPQSVAGILWQFGPGLGVHSEEDQARFPALEELSTSLKDLIESGRIVEVSPHRYREAKGRANLPRAACWLSTKRSSRWAPTRSKRAS
jgi:hypothetical protein